MLKLVVMMTTMIAPTYLAQPNQLSPFVSALLVQPVEFINRYRRPVFGVLLEGPLRIRGLANEQRQ